MGLSLVPAYPWEEKFQSRTLDAKARKSGMYRSQCGDAPFCGSATHSFSRCCPSVSRRLRTAPALTSAGADTTSPVGRTNPIHSRWAATWGLGFGMAVAGYVGANTRTAFLDSCR